MPFYAGLDIGSRTAKALVLDDNNKSEWTIIDTEPEMELTARKAFQKILSKTGIAADEVISTVATGYGRVVVSFAHSITEITCHARGAVWYDPEVRLILDMGGQDSKAIKCDASGKVIAFALNEKCAAGTGRYLERIAEAIGVPVGETGALAVEGTQPVQISSICAVFAQNEITRYLREGKPIKDILAGACQALVRRQIPLLKRVGMEGKLMFCGGVAKNIGVVRTLEKQTGMPVFIPPEPQIVGVMGAALLAKELKV